MKTFVLCAIVGFIVVTPPLPAQTKTSADTAKAATTPAPIPEEARKHFVMGTALFKDAKTAGDFSQVESEFTKAADLAPQWPDARYDLALAKEAAGDYSGAMADLKLYQQFKLPEAEARTVQDKIYVLDAKQAKRVSDDAAKTAAEAALAKEREPHFDGRWDLLGDERQPSSRWYFTISGPSSAQVSEMFGMSGEGNGFTVQNHSNSLSNFQTSGRRVTFRVTANYVLHNASLGKGYFNFDNIIYDFELTLSDDGKFLKGTITSPGGDAHQISFSRH